MKIIIMFALLLSSTVLFSQQKLVENGKTYIKIDGVWYWDLSYGRVRETPSSMIQIPVSRIPDVQNTSSNTNQADNTTANQQWASDMQSVSPKPVYNTCNTTNTTPYRDNRPVVITRVKTGNTVVIYRW